MDSRAHSSLLASPHRLGLLIHFHPDGFWNPYLKKKNFVIMNIGFADAAFISRTFPFKWL